MYIMIDNYDSFVHNIVRYLEELDADVSVFRNNRVTIETLVSLQPQGIIISPGPCTPNEAGISLDAIKYFAGKIPILGICLGHQAIAQVFGGRIIKGKEPVHGKLSLIKHDDKGVFRGIKNPYQVTRYHSLVVDKHLPYELEISALSQDGAVMGIRHKKYPIEGVQFHPEAHLTEHGHDLLRNFLEMCE